MRKILFLYLLIQSIYSYGQDRIDYINIENSSSHLWSNTTIYIESPNADFSSTNNNKDGKVLVEIKMNLKDNKDYKKIKYIDRIDYEEITKNILSLTAQDLFPKLGCLDGNHTTLSFSNNNNSVKYDVSCVKKDTNFHQIIKLILEKINLKEKDFYR